MEKKAHLFPMYHENVKEIYVRGRSGEVANRVVAESFENSKVSKVSDLARI